MASVKYDWGPRIGQALCYQAPGRSRWGWQRGDKDHFWAFSIRPQQAGVEVEVVAQWTVSDDRLAQTEQFDIEVRGRDGYLMFTAIQVGP